MLFAIAWAWITVLIKAPLTAHNSFMKKYRTAEAEGKFDGIN